MSAQGLRRAAEMAYRVLVNQQIRTLPVDPLKLLQRCRDTVVRTYEEAADSLGIPPEDFARQFGDAEAFTLRRESEGTQRFIVVYRSDGNPARQRFTLAHELGHRLLGHTGQSEQEERAADCFASHLLCPRPVIARLAKRFQPLYAEQAAAVCYVSLSCARTLADELDINMEEKLLKRVDEQLQDFADTVVPVSAQRMRHAIIAAGR